MAAAAPAVHQDDHRPRLAQAVVRERHAVVGRHELGLVRQGARDGGERHASAAVMGRVRSSSAGSVLHAAC